MSKTQADEIATFGRVATRHEEDYSQMQGFLIEEWQVLDESATGFRLMRPLERTGARIGSGQMVAIMPEGSRSFLLAVFSMNWGEKRVPSASRITSLTRSMTTSWPSSVK